MPNTIQAISHTPLPALPKSWSELQWHQLTHVWEVKLRYGGNPDVARAAALMTLCGLSPVETAKNNDYGETVYHLRGSNGELFSTTARELSYYAKQALPWFDFPYGDQGEKEVTDDRGKVIKERRSGVSGYVSPMRDAMILPQTEIEIDGALFSLPQAACNNLTWEQYRALQVIVPQLFSNLDGDVSATAVLDMQTQFMAHCLVPAQVSIDINDRFSPPHTFKYNSQRAEQTIPFWRVQLPCCPTLFHICFQAYQTALSYYYAAYPLLFSDGKTDTMRDALQGEVDTINAIMMEAKYTNQQEVYDSNMPFIFGILNTMAKKAHEIEKMNAKIKKK